MRRAPERETAYPWGDEIKLNGEAMANCNGCGSQWDGKQTAPVDSFSANEFGLYQMVGNVWEWTEDCWNHSYAGRAGRRLAMDERRLQFPRRPRRFLGRQSSLPPLGEPRQGQHRQPGQQPGLPGRPDAYPLNLDLLTSWGPGAKPLVEFFGG